MKKKKQKQIHVTIDPRLDQYNNVILFPKKVEEAKKTITRVGLPGAVKKNQ